MPELPEVETTARGLRPLLVGRRIVDVGEIDWPNMLPNAQPDELVRALRGDTVKSVERRGKYLRLALVSGASLVLHRKMSGNVVLHAAAAPRKRHTHLVVGFDNGSELHFVDPRKFGRVYYFRTEADVQDFYAGRLGPEALGDLTAARLAERIAGRGRRIKALLIDQSVVAGLGNLYADEALWHASLHPERTGASLSDEEIARLAAAIALVLEGAIERRGTSFSDYVDADGVPGQNQDYLVAYGRAGQPCFRCGRPIERRLVAQRGTWYCPSCQALPAPAGPPRA